LLSGISGFIGWMEVGDRNFEKNRKNGAKTSKLLKLRKEDDKFNRFGNYYKILWGLIGSNL